MIKQLLFILFFTSSSFLSAQVSKWLIPIDSAGIISLSTDDQGNVYALGECTRGLSVNGTYFNSPNLSNKTLGRGFICKIDSMGILQWVKQFGSGFSNWSSLSMSSIEVDNSNDILVHFTIRNDTLQIENDTTVYLPSNPRYNNYSRALAKFDRNGIFQWLNILPYHTDNGPDQYKYIRTDKFNNIYVRHDTGYYAGIRKEFHLLKLDASGNILDTLLIGRRGIFSIDPNGNVWVPWSNDDFPSDTLLMKYNASGNIIETIKAGSGEAYIDYISVDQKGGLYVDLRHNRNVGFSFGGYNFKTYETFSNYQENYFTIKLNRFKNLIWVKESHGACNVNWPQLSWGGVRNPIPLSNGNFLLRGTYRQSVCLNGDSIWSPKANDSTSILLTEVNENGNVLWQKRSYGANYHIPWSAVGAINDNIYVSIGGTDSMYIDNLSQIAYGSYILRIKDASNIASGKVFIDSNNNSIPDNSDRFVSDQLIEVNGNSHHYTFSNQNGEYKAYLTNGTYSIDYNKVLNHHTVLPANHALSFTGGSQIDTDNHFQLTPISGKDDLRVRIIPYLAQDKWNDGFARVDLIYENIGSTSISDTCVLQFDPRLSFLSSTVQPTNTVGNLSWIFQNLKPYEKVRISLRFRFNNQVVNVNVGDSLHFASSIYLHGSDVDPVNNVDSNYSIVLGSYDPNDKMVKPDGDIKPKFVQEGKYIYYTIRFQNTGTAPASYVRIRDSLSRNLQLKSFEMLSSSHAHQLEYFDPRIIDFVFENINLPDSATDPEGSVGYVSFRIKADPTLTHGDYIENNAAIFFDNNEPIITNTTRTDISLWASVEDSQKSQKGLVVFPNPNSGEFNISVPSIEDETANLMINDIAGRRVLEMNNIAISNKMIHLENLNLEDGVYIIQVQMQSEILESKMIISSF